MPIFELDGGRPVPVQPMQPAPGSFEVEVEALVSEHLESLLNERVFPVLHANGSDEGPQALALDVHGQPVVAEVVRVLDGEGLVRALRHAGTASRLSTDDLARGYADGPRAFSEDLLAFRESLPIAVRNAPSRGTGTRVVVFCAEVAENLLDAVEFLRQPGRQVAILQVGVVRGHDGRRLLEVAPLGAQPMVRRPVEPASLRLVQSQDAFAEAMAYDGGGPEGGGRRLPRPKPEINGNGLHLGGPNGFSVSTGQHLIVTGQNPLVPDPARPAPPLPTTDPVPVVREAARQVQERLRRDREQEPEARTPLVAMAGEIGTTTLVWHRERRGERFEAVLRADGKLQLADGQVFVDPNAAATAVAGADNPVDGWRAWRLGDHGPTLAQAAGIA